MISQRTLAIRLERVLGARLIEPERLVGDLHLRPRAAGMRDRLLQTMTTVIGRLGAPVGRAQDPLPLLALDWGCEPQELLVGRSSCCDLVLSHPTVSRRHARLIRRDGCWVLQDLGSTNGSHLNGRSVGRCQLRPGDELWLGEARLRVD
ncbi:MAG TPA: FHA domain-containing protein [Solirubrobacteraceae bacterium]|nr:FHA domain-containing protein [Solirubrobacteraceae bacterium]